MPQHDLAARLERLEDESVHVIREARSRSDRAALLWSMGKDSTALLWLCRKAFLGAVPFPVLHIDTSFKFPGMYEFRDRIAREWGLDLHVVRNERALAAGCRCNPSDPTACCGPLKTEALKMYMERQDVEILLVGIRADEHAVRAKERAFSWRAADFTWPVGSAPMELWDLFTTAPTGAHTRVHPLLRWTERDVWAYVAAESIPVCDLYFARQGLRYRSLGCMSATAPLPSQASTVEAILEELETTEFEERAGRAQDKEGETMQRLRALGYM